MFMGLKGDSHIEGSRLKWIAVGERGRGTEGFFFFLCAEIVEYFWTKLCLFASSFIIWIVGQIFFMRYISSTLIEILQIWHRLSLELKDELIRILWTYVICHIFPPILF